MQAAEVSTGLATLRDWAPTAAADGPLAYFRERKASSTDTELFLLGRYKAKLTKRKRVRRFAQSSFQIGVHVMMWQWPSSSSCYLRRGTNAVVQVFY